MDQNKQILKVRNATTEDLPRALELLKEMLQFHNGFTPGVYNEDFSFDDYHRTFFDAEKDGRYLIVAANEGGVVGVCNLKIDTRLDNSYAPGMRKTLLIDGICVDKDHRRQGIATAMEKYAENLAKQKGINMVWAEIAEANDPSRKLHGKSGYQVLEVIYYKDLRENC